MYRNGNILIILCSLAYWGIESGIDAYLFKVGPLQERLFYPDINEIWMRAIVIMLFSIAIKLLVWSAKNEKEFQRELLINERVRAIGEMTTGIAHEIRTPLSSVVGFSDLLEDELKKSGQQTIGSHSLEYLNKIQSSSMLISEIIENIGSLSGDMIQGGIECADIRPVIVGSQSLCSARLKRYEIEVIRILPEHPVMVECRPSALSQVFVNLINNAIDATKESSERRIKIQLETTAEEAIISVEDSGSGVSEKMQRQMFKRFETSKSEGKGLGIGLNISRKIIENYKGSLRLESPRNPTRMTIRLPLSIQ